MYGAKPKEALTFQKILELISEYDIFKFYCSNFKELGNLFCSELREDKKPSCIISTLERGLIYKDFSTGHYYNCFQYVRAKFNCDFITALNIINNDFKLELSGNNNVKSNSTCVPVVHNLTLIPKEKCIININIKNFSKKDLEYWKQYNINKEILDFYNVKSLNAYSINGDWIYNKNLCFAYKLGNKKNIKLYKILSPLNIKYKWFSNTDSSTLQGINQAIKQKPKLLFITSSLKDVMALYSIGFTAIAPASETVVLNEIIINKLKEKVCSNIIMFFDNDEAGKQSSKKYEDAYGFKSICVDEYKDPSDFIKFNTPEKLKTLINEKLNAIFYT